MENLTQLEANQNNAEGNVPYSKILREKLISEKAGGNLNFTEKRILKDLEEFEFNVSPDMGISARPLKDTIYKWHANIKGMSDTPYEGGIFHLLVSIPGDYPNKPPTIETITPMTNNFFISGKYRSEMVEDDWCSGYSLYSLLLQIQFGLFDYQSSQENNITQEATASKTFKCKNCEHHGLDKIYPPFESALENGPVNYASKSEEEKLIEDTYCFHTRMNVKETTQGTGVAFKRQMRTTEVSRIYTTIDLVSRKAYEEGLRKSVNKKRFSHWLPLYFKDTCKIDKTVDLFRKHLSDIAAGSKNKFDEDMILTIMPKLLLTHIAQLMNDKAYSSIKGIRMLNYFHRAFLFMLEQHPQVQFKLEKQIELFMNDEEYRSREKTPDVGMILGFLCASRKYRFPDIIKQFLNEKFARNVFLIMKEIPEFENISSQNYNQEFAQKVFKASENSWRFVMFMAFYNNFIIDKNLDKRNMDIVIEEYDKRYSRLYYKIEEEIQKEVDSIKNIDNFNDFFNKIGVPAVSSNDLKEILINSVISSKQKGYHGGVNAYFPIPEAKTQVKEILSKKVTATSLYNPFDEENKVMDDDEDFLKYIKQRFEWIHQYFLINSDITPEDLAIESDYRNSTEKQVDGLREIVQGKYHWEMYGQIQKANSHRVYKGMSWKDLFMKLDLEEYLTFNEYSQDNETLQEYLNICAPFIKGLVLRQPRINSDKISYSSYTKVIAACSSTLEKLILVGWTEIYPITQGFIMSVRLGLKSAENIQIKEIELHHVNFADRYGEPMPLDTWEKIGYTDLLKLIPKLDTLRFSNMSMSVICIKSLFGAIKPEALKELTMINSGLDKYSSKELSTLLENSNELQILNISHNKIEYGVKDIFKALQGKPQLRVFDISYNFLTHVQALTPFFEKFINDTPWLEFLNFDFTNIHENLSVETLECLGGLKKLIGFSFESSTCKMSAGCLKSIAKAIVTSKNNESDLQYVILRGCINTYPDYEEFFEQLASITPVKDMEALEGFELVNDPMSDAPKALLKYLDISQGNFNSGFDQCKLKAGECPGLKYIFSLVEALNMDSCHLDEKDARMIRYWLKDISSFASIKSLILSNNAFGSKGAEALSTIKIEELDISNCKIGVGGAHSFSKSLSENSPIKILFLYGNGIKVEGCRFIAKSLEENKNLEVLDLGSNTIRNKGFDDLSTVLKSQIKLLAVKNNKIKDKAFNEFVNKYLESGNTTLKTILLASNEISMYSIKNAEECTKDTIYMDLSLKLENHNERTLFLCGILPANKKPQLKKFFDSKNWGVIENIDILQGKEKKKGKQNIFGFVRFAHVNGKMRVVKQISEIEENKPKIKKKK